MRTNTILLLDPNAADAELLEQISLAIADAGFDPHFLSSPDDVLPHLGGGSSARSSGVILVGPKTAEPLATAARVAHADPNAEIIILSNSLEPGFLESAIPAHGMHISTASHTDTAFGQIIRSAAERAAARMQEHHTASGTATMTSSTPSPAAEAPIISDHYLASILTHAQDAIISTDTAGVVLTWNHGAQMLLGLQARDAVGKPIAELAGGDWRAQFPALVRIAHRGGVIRSRTLNTVRANGTSADIEIALAPILSDIGTRTGMSVVARDITHRKRGEQERERLANHVALLLDATFEGVFGMDREGVVTFINRAAAGMFGYDPEELLGANMHTVTHHSREDGSAYPAEDCPIRRTATEGGIHRSDKEVFWRKDGGSFAVEYSSFPVMDGTAVTGAMVIFRNVNEQRAAREELKRSRDEIEVILEGVADGITAQDASGRLIYANESAARLVGFDTVAEMLRIQPDRMMAQFEVFDEDGNPADLNLLPGRQALQGVASPEAVLKFRVVATGEEHWVVVKARPMFDHLGKVRFAINIFRAIDHIKEAEERLRFLVEASEVLASSLDYETTLASVTALAVPKMGDWAAMDMLSPEGTLDRLAVAHVDPEKVKWAHEIQRRYPPDMTAPTGVPNVLRTGLSEFYPVITDEMLVAGAKDQEGLDLGREIGFSSVLIVPLIVRDKPIGAITLVHAESGRHYTESDLALAEDLARRASVAIDNSWLHRAAHDQREWLRVTISSIGDAVIATDTEGRITFMNPVAERLTRWLQADAFGMDLPEVFRIVNEKSRAIVANPVEKVLRSGHVVGLANHTVLIAKDGAEIPIDDSAAPIRDGEGEMLGVVMVFHDITERRRAERERAGLLAREQKARAEAEENERQFRLMAEAMPQIVWTARADGSVEYYNSRWYEYSGLPAGEPGSPIVHPDDNQRSTDQWAQSISTGKQFEIEYRLRRASDGAYRWHLGRAVPVRDDSDTITRWIGTATDIDDQKSAEDRLEYLAAASEILGSSLDYQTTLVSVTNLAVPKIADWASVDVLAPDGSVERLAVAHVDPEKVKWAHELQHRYPPDQNAPTGVHNVIRTGQSEFYPVLTDEMLAAAALDEEQLEIIRQIGFSAAMTVPLIVRGKPVGAISFVAAESGRRYSERDLALAQDLARRAGMAIENAELFTTAQNEIAERRRAETESRRAGEAIRESEERFRSMADRAPVLIWMVGPDGLATYFNETWLEFTGRPLADQLGNGWIDDIHPDDARRTLDVHHGAYARREEFQLEYRLRRADGEYRWLLDTGVPRLSAQEEFLGYIGSSLDITDRKQAEIDLQTAKDVAEAANQAKDRFLAVLSHELRTPLTPVLTLTQALKEDDLPTDIRTFVEIIDRNVGLEARLIDDLLDITKIEKGKLQLNLETADAHLLLNNVLEIYRSDIVGKDLRIVLELNARNRFVRADTARLQQIFWNLVKNAVKFTPAGGRVTISSRNDDAGHLLVQVSDTGIGIEPEVMPQIFAAFEQGDQGITRQFGGLGLGLAISKALVEMHGGRLSATSEGRHQGATFTVELATAAAAAATGPAEAPGHSAEQPARRILLVDDHEDTSKVMKVLLERRGYRVTTAATMQGGIDAAMNGTFDLLISDIGLPDGSGLDLMATLIRNGSRLTGIALSGFGMEDDIRRSKEVGFTEHLTKPISFQKLQDIIERLIGK